ncbi:DUF5623 domain-containing protein [Pseudomonas sp. NPDC089569]|uniref:DUF5623 domain-containing protein n=1 Tax=Pseudomonas sp. NPDC089569 TaxID=3390722 RepID=UPI003CFBCE91
MKSTAPSLVWIKRRAKSIKATAGVPHHQALEAAARESGYQNFRHAQSEQAGTLPSHHNVYLSVYWCDHKDRTQSGRLTLCVQIRRPILSFLTKHQVTNQIPYLTEFKLEYLDHLEKSLDACSLHSAYITARQAAKALNFVERTGLLGASANSYGSRSPFRTLQDLPRKDHGSGWCTPNDPADWCYLDEPYHEYDDRPDWASSRGFGYTAEGGLGQGIYLGGGPIGAHACIFAATHEKALELMGVLNAVTEEQDSWIVTHATHDTDFLSPARIANGQNRKPRTKPAAAGTIRGGAIAYGGLPGEKSLWRPAEPLPLPIHNEIGPLTYALFDWTDGHPRLRAAMRDVRNTLQYWLNAEHCDMKWFDGTEGVSGKYRLFEYAYRGLTNAGKLAASAIAAEVLVSTDAGRLHALQQIKDILVGGYPDCTPLRGVLKRIDFLIERIKRTNP